MENSGEIDVVEYLRLMKDYLEDRIDAERYTKNYFELTKHRVNIRNEGINRVTQQAYGDADDYEPDATLRKTDPRWIGEAELKDRVRESLRELEALQN
jgi:hypothetical protein